MRGMSDESYLRAIDGLCYHGELLSDCLPLPCLTWTEVAPCVARFSPLAPSQFSGLIFKIEALQHHPPTYGPGPPPHSGSPVRNTSPFEQAAQHDAPPPSLLLAQLISACGSTIARDELRCANVAAAPQL